MSEQIDEALVSAYTTPLDPAARGWALVNLVSWSCYTAARRIASWLGA